LNLSGQESVRGAWFNVLGSRGSKFPSLVSSINPSLLSGQAQNRAQDRLCNL